MSRGDSAVGGDTILDLEGGRDSMADCSSKGGDGSTGSGLHRWAVGGRELDRLFDFHGRAIVMVIDDLTGASTMAGEC